MWQPPSCGYCYIMLKMIRVWITINKIESKYNNKLKLIMVSYVNKDQVGMNHVHKDYCNELKRARYTNLPLPPYYCNGLLNKKGWWSLQWNLSDLYVKLYTLTYFTVDTGIASRTVTYVSIDSIHTNSTIQTRVGAALIDIYRNVQKT